MDIEKLWRSSLGSRVIESRILEVKRIIAKQAEKT